MVLPAFFVTHPSLTRRVAIKSTTRKFRASFDGQSESSMLDSVMIDGKLPIPHRARDMITMSFETMGTDRSAIG